MGWRQNKVNIYHSSEDAIDIIIITFYTFFFLFRWGFSYRAGECGVMVWLR